MRKVLMMLVVAIPLFAQEVGKVSFANSGAPQAQDAFARGLALLHNFEYSDAFDAFREAQRLDPEFAMAYWGEAMTHNHPIWFRQDAAAARAVLAKLDRNAKMTQRERDYIATLDVLYGEGPKNDRDLKYAEAMRSLHEKYPDDVDARAFHALSLLGTAHEGRDFATYMRAAALLEEVFPANQRHPGVLHYLIHSYDDPVHAPLGMRAARLYGAVAPNAGHALHMTSHIFVAMAMWDDVIDANKRAIDVVNAQRAARGRPPQACGHYPTWLHYGYLQKNRIDDATKALDACRAFALRANEKNFFNEYAEMRAHHVATGHGLTEAAAIPEEFVEARYALAYADALGGRDAAAIASVIGRLRALQPAVLAEAAKETNPSKRIRAEVMLQQAEALLLVAQNKRAEALPILEAAAKAERTMPLEFGPPAIPKPASEMYAEQLLLAGRAADSVAAYNNVFARTPGRSPALDGFARAKKAAGELVAAEKPMPPAHVH
jgi:hypothetical protein